jgi:hypothetical protein
MGDGANFGNEDTDALTEAYANHSPLSTIVSSNDNEFVNVLKKSRSPSTQASA